MMSALGLGHPGLARVTNVRCDTDSWVKTNNTVLSNYSTRQIILSTNRFHNERYQTFKILFKTIRNKQRFAQVLHLTRQGTRAPYIPNYQHPTTSFPKQIL